MASPGEKLVAGGAWVRIVADGENLGLCSGVSYQEDFNVQPLLTLGYLGPLDFDSQGYSLSIGISTYVPEKKNAGPYPDGGSKALQEFLPTRKEVFLQGGKPARFAVIQFVNTYSNAVVNQFEKVVIATNGTQIAPNSYITANIGLVGVERTI